MKDLAGPCELPKSWTWTILGEIAKGLRAGGTPSKKVREFYEGGSIPFVKIEDMVNSKKYLYNTITKITEKGLANSSAWIVPENSLLYSMYASYGIPTINKIEVATNQAIIVFQPPTGLISLDYVYYFLLSTRPSLKKYLRGTTQPNLNAAIVRSLPVPLAPLPEQHRIVARIEELFSHLDAGVQALQKAKAQLQRYRQAVLKAAVEGRLTEEWRKAHPEVEPAEKLLERILSLKQEKLGRKYNGSNELDTTDLPELPESWLWARLDSLADLKGGITKDKKRKVRNGRKVPYLRVANVQRGYLDLKEIKEIEVSEDIILDLHLERGDILFNEGGDRDKLGRGWIWQEELPECIHQNHVFRARLYSNEVSNKFISWFGNTFGQTYFLREGKQTTNLASVNLTKLSAFPVPLPPGEEQQAIIEKIDTLLSAFDESEKTINQSLKRSYGLRQSILQRAFQGKLVPQDPNDEPASLLLERIRAERIKESPRRGRKSNTNQARLCQ